MIPVAGAILGYFLGLKIVLGLFICFILFIIWDTERTNKRIEAACSESRIPNDTNSNSIKGIRF